MKIILKEKDFYAVVEAGLRELMISPDIKKWVSKVVVLRYDREIPEFEIRMDNNKELMDIAKELAEPDQFTKKLDETEGF